ncbi:hypothetical protein VNI00_013899 [Paramarasmius palmivorus]|uniref:Uncharacterized protein n=1 Tax=Paramarasmius palmivorus TaxID=297713 RepID=A0AAW0BY11_9AGAR
MFCSDPEFHGDIPKIKGLENPNFNGCRSCSRQPLRLFLFEHGLESAVNSLDIPGPLVITGLVLFALYIFVPRVFNWLYTCPSVEELQESLSRIEKLIEDNTNVSEDNYNLRGATMVEFEDRQLDFDNEIDEHRRMTRYDEPPKWRVVAWVAFKWKGLMRAGEIHAGMRKLEGEIEAEVAGVTLLRRGDPNSAANIPAFYASGVDV